MNEQTVNGITTALKYALILGLVVYVVQNVKSLFGKSEEKEVGSDFSRAQKLVQELLQEGKIKTGDVSVATVYAYQTIQDQQGWFLSDWKVKDVVWQKYGINAPHYGYSGAGGEW